MKASEDRNTQRSVRLENQVGSYIEMTTRLLTGETPDIKVVSAEGTTIFSVILSEGSRGALIGRGGHTLNSLQELLRSMSGRLGHNYIVEVIG